MKTDPPGGKELGSSPPLTGVVGMGVCGLRVPLAKGRRQRRVGWAVAVESVFKGALKGVLIGI